jgi:hypothetical protein
MGKLGNASYTFNRVPIDDAIAKVDKDEGLGLDTLRYVGW